MFILDFYRVKLGVTCIFHSPLLPLCLYCVYAFRLLVCYPCGELKDIDYYRWNFNEVVCSKRGEVTPKLVVMLLEFVKFESSPNVDYFSAYNYNGHSRCRRIINFK